MESHHRSKKKSDVVPRIALALHVFQHATTTLLNGTNIQTFPTTITKETLLKAKNFVEHLMELQKEALCEVRATSTQTLSYILLNIIEQLIKHNGNFTLISSF